MGLRLPNLDYYTMLGGIGDNIVNAIDKYQAPELLRQAMAMQGGGQMSAPAAILGGQPVPTSSPSTPQGQPSGGLGMAQDTNPEPPKRTASVGAGFTEIFDRAAKAFGVSPDYLTKTAFIESRGDPSAANPSGARGLFQFMPETAQQYGLSNPNDPAASTVAAARLAADNRASLQKVLGREPTDAELYLAHQQGAGGAAKLLSNPNVPAAALVGPKAVVQNGGDPNMTAGQFANLWISKYNSLGAPQGGAVPPPNQVADANGTITPQSAPPDAQPQQRGPQYSPQVIQRLMANPYTRAYGQLLMQNMMKQETPAFHQFGNTVYRQQGGQLVPVVNVPEKPMTMSEGQTLVDPRTGQVISNIPKGPMTMSEGQTLVDPKTGQVISTIPKDRPPVTLSEGQVLVDPKTGNMIATGGMKNDVAKNNSQREAEADRLGLQGDDRTQYIFNGKVPSQAEKQTDGQANAALYASRMREAENILSKPEIQAASMDRMQIAKSKAPLGIGNSLVTKEYQMADQAKRDFINATLRRESGAAISPSEFDNAEKQYFPQPGDKPEVLSQKAANRKTAMEGIANAASPNFKEQFFGTKKPTLGENKAQREPLPKGYSAARAVSEAKQAIEQGRDPEGVKARLKTFGIDPSILDK